MAARKRLFHEEEVKAKIRTSQLINRLNSFIMGKVELSPAQVTAALGLIRKKLPDLSSVDMEVENKLATYDISDKPLTAEEWAARASEANSLGTNAGPTETTH